MSARIAEWLSARGGLDAGQLRLAQREQQRSGGRFGEALLALGLLDEAGWRDAQAACFGQPTVALERIEPDRAALALIPAELARATASLPLALDADRLLLAVAHAGDLDALDRLRHALGGRRELETALATVTDIDCAIDRCYGAAESLAATLARLEREGGAAVIAAVDALLGDAARRGASDLHFEPEAQTLTLRRRVDGVLETAAVLPKEYWPTLLVRLKVLAGLDIADSRTPQDGRVSLRLAGRDIDCRVATLPTVHGETLTARLLDRRRGLSTLTDLGLALAQQTQLLALLRRPEGLLLITGPTGSGKTTTLYSLLDRLDRDAMKIMTLEDPVEYALPRVRQTAIGPQLDFADGVRALLRHDPDVMLIGEIRDRDTAEMALQAAATGHLVLSSLHSASAVGAIGRLADLGIAPKRLAGLLVALIGQRLLRRTCADCGAGTDPTCPRCGGSGYRGRLAVMEIVEGEAEIDPLLLAGHDAAAIAAALRRSGKPTLVEEAWRNVGLGVTRAEEVQRVFGKTPDQ